MHPVLTNWRLRRIGLISCWLQGRRDGRRHGFDAHGVEAHAAACVPSGGPGRRHYVVGHGRQRRGAAAAQGPDQHAGTAPAAAAAPQAGGLGFTGHRVRRGGSDGVFAWWAFDSNRHMEADAARKQQFVDTASQTVVNMFSYNQNSIDET